MDEFEKVIVEGKELNYYEFLGLDINVKDTKDIRKAFRAKSLVYHPDKNTDKPDADQLFVLLKKAHDTLTDELKRIEYDTYLKNVSEKKNRIKMMDSKRKKQKEDLERREKDARDQKLYERQQAKRHESDMDNLRRNFATEATASSNTSFPTAEKVHMPKIKTQAELLSLKLKFLEKELKASDTTLKVKWKKELKFTEEDLNYSFSAFGSVEHVLFAAKKKGVHALVSFTNVVGPNFVMQSKNNNDPRLDDFEISWTNSENKQPERVTEILQLMEEIAMITNKESEKRTKKTEKKKRDYPKELLKKTAHLSIKELEAMVQLRSQKFDTSKGRSTTTI